jgi:hypothetical protein
VFNGLQRAFPQNKPAFALSPLSFLRFASFCVQIGLEGNVEQLLKIFEEHGVLPLKAKLTWSVSTKLPWACVDAWEEVVD